MGRYVQLPVRTTVMPIALHDVLNNSQSFYFFFHELGTFFKNLHKVDIISCHNMLSDYKD